MGLPVRFAISFACLAWANSVIAEDSSSHEEDFSVLGVNMGSSASSNPYVLASPLIMDRPSGFVNKSHKRSCESYIRRWSIGFVPNKFRKLKEDFEKALNTGARIGFESNGLSLDTSLGGRISGGWYKVPAISSFNKKNKYGNVCFVYLDDKLFTIFFNDIPAEMIPSIDRKYAKYMNPTLNYLFELPNGVFIYNNIYNQEIGYTDYKLHFSYLDEVVPLYVEALRNKAGNVF